MTVTETVAVVAVIVGTVTFLLSLAAWRRYRIPAR